MRSMSTYRRLPSTFEVSTSSTGHRAGGREAVSPSDCLWVGTKGHVPSGDLDECFDVRVAANCGRVPWRVLPNWEHEDHQEGGGCVSG